MTFSVRDKQSTDKGCRGFSMKFSNGYRVSVQFGYINYCDNGLHNQSHIAAYVYDSLCKQVPNECQNAEIAIVEPDGSLLECEGFDQVRGYCSADLVAGLLATVAQGDEGSVGARVAAYLRGCHD